MIISFSFLFSLPSSFRWLYSSRSVRPFQVVVRASGMVVTYICLHFDPFCTTLFCSRGHIAYRAFFFFAVIGLNIFRSTDWVVN